MVTLIREKQKKVPSDLIDPCDWKAKPGCEGYYEDWSGEYDCGYGSTLTCEECKYGGGRKDPEAKRNQL